MQWPEFEGRVKIPEGHYSFRMNREPELKSFPYKDKDGNAKSGRKIVIYAIGLNDEGEFPVVDAIVAWEERYADLCKALGVEHGRDLVMAGSRFEADIIHEPDKTDPTKSYPRLTNIIAVADIPPSTGPGDEDIPF
jgi:hypothetical protein